MTPELQDELLRRALLDAAAADFAGEAEAVPMSPRQEKRMRSMLADPFAYARRARRPWWRQAMHTAAMLAVTLGLSVALLAALSPTVRAAIKQWFLELRQSDIVYYFTGETREEELPYYTITELPEGYAYLDEQSEDGYRRIRYENANGQRIRLEYAPMEAGSAFWISTKDMVVRDVTVNGCPGQVFLSLNSEEGNAVVWMDADENFQFFINAFADESALLHMAESISLVKTEKP